VTDWQPPAEPHQPLPHLAFWQAASKAAEGSTDYEILTSGLLVLRILDRWRFRAKTSRDVTFQEFVHVKRKAESLPESPIRQVLADLINTISDYAYGTADSRVAKLLDFARLLEESAYWEPAADVYATVIEIIASRPEDRDRLPRCYERQAYCLRQVGEIEKAEELLLDGIEIANDLNDVYGSLYMRIASAVIELQKGDLPEAEFELDTIIDDAEKENEPHLLALAIHERGAVAYERNQYEKAVAFFHTAAQKHVQPHMVRRALTDLALALGELGHQKHALRVFRAVRRAPETEAEPRAIAGLNLMHAAIFANDQAGFDRLRGELDQEQMSGRLQAHYWLFVGEGFHHFGDAVAARTAFEQAIAMARQFKVYKLLTEAQAMLSATNDRPVPWREPKASPALATVFAEIEAEHGVFAGATAN
jgi:tetratricopeptide (TPR) repeat protein